jgi:Ca-activated chloride channel family protein
MSIELGRPGSLALLALLPIWWLWVRPMGLAGLLVPRGQDVEALALGGWRGRAIEWLPLAMRMAALVCLVLVLSQPRIVRVIEEPITEGVGVAFAIDLSSSMWAQDMAEHTTRLEVAKATVQSFLRQRSDDVGLVAFAGESLIRLPLTHDPYAVEMAVEAMEVGLAIDGTDVAGAIAAGAGLLKDTPHSSKVLILVTDGAHNKAGMVPSLAARAAATFGIKVYPIAIGTDEAQGAQAEAMETVLSQTARITGGQYFRASNVEALQEIYDEIDRLETVSEVMVEREQAIPLGLWLLLTGIALVVGTTTLRGSWWGLVP